MITELPTSDAPILLDIFKEIQSTQYGDVNITITNHRGIPVGMTVASFRHEKFVSGENAKALTWVVSLIKKMIDARETGQLTFTVVFNQGETKEIIHQFYDKKSYKVPQLTE